MFVDINNPELIKNCSFINGEWLPSQSSFCVENPAYGEILGEVNEITPEQLEYAVNSAFTALETWQVLTVDVRSALLKNWFKLIMENQHDLAEIMTAEQGKTRAEAMGEVAYGAKYIEWYAEEARRVNGDVLPVNQHGRRAMVLQRPIGVVGAITPWNFPGAMILRKAAAALAAGCTFIVKPSELTPYSALALGVLAEKARLPAGVFNVVVGSNAQPIGEVLTTHPKIAKFSFTGSTAVGKRLLQQCASTVKKTSMELGGNAPFIVFDDAKLEDAVKGAIGSKFRNSGQTCVCANRIFVHRKIYTPFIEALAVKVGEMTVGVGTSNQTKIGPLINEKARSKVNRLVEQALDAGAKVICGGRSSRGLSGYFYEPTIIQDVTPEMDIFNEEIFGPVAAIIPFDDEATVIQLANATEYGLCSYVFTQDLNRVWRMSEKLEFGMVGINEGILSNAAAPFGGIKASGMGREGGRWGINDYLETRYVCIGNVD